jgi:hypothetical protein
VANLYFQLTEEFNAGGTVVVLASGQAVVFHRLAIMSKDGDWVIRESEEACQTVLAVLRRHGARHRPAPPLDPRWLAGGWSSHFEFGDARSRRVRCDFVSRPPRLDPEEQDRLFAESAGQGAMRVLDVERLIRIKQTQRAKDYPVIGELARLLPAEKELELSTDPDRVLDLARRHGAASARPSVRAAHQGGGRDAVLTALALELDAMQRADRERLVRYEAAARPYLEAFRADGLAELPLEVAHARAVELADRLLPKRV